MRLEDLPRLEFADPGPARDEVVAAILAGRKTTTTGLVLEYERAGQAFPAPGQQFVVIDSDRRPAALIGDPGFAVGDDTVVLAQRFRLVRALTG